MLKKLLVGVSLLATLGCQPELPALKMTDPVTMSVTTPQPACGFQSAAELRNYLEAGIQMQLPNIVATYNKHLGTNFLLSDVKIEFSQWQEEQNTYPEFFYDFDEHKLKLEFVPAKNPDEYVKNLCSPGSFRWEIYDKITIGFVPHEVGHWYHDQLMKKKDITISWDENNLSVKRGAGLVIEGAAVYLETLIKPEESYRNKQDYTNPYEQLLGGAPYKLWVYPAGEMLVRPIMEENPVGGLLAMSKDPPRPKRPSDLVRYQRRILKKLE